VEANSPGEKGYVRKGDFILEINGDDAVDMVFDYVINVIKLIGSQNYASC
jgi:C-terminal processing protease CtpA/Prc